MDHEQKPRWMAEHEASDTRQFDDIRNALQRIEIKLDPIFDNYTTATRMGKWGMALMMVLSVLLGLILSLKALFNK
jgi:5,10-methylenetetrahydrofolate reductase